VGGAGSSAGAGAGGTAGDTGGGAGVSEGGSASAGGSDTQPEANILFEERFEDGDTDDWYKECATFTSLSEAAADGTAFGAQLVETRGGGCEWGGAAIDLGATTPSRVEWWMRNNSRGEVFGNFEIASAIVLYVGDQTLAVYDGQELRTFDIDSAAWHRYELHDIDWASRTFSLAVDGEVEAESFGFYEPKDNAEYLQIVAVAIDMASSDPVSVSVDEIVVYE
jgi:hypothetical protein